MSVTDFLIGYAIAKNPFAALVMFGFIMVGLGLLLLTVGLVYIAVVYGKDPLTNLYTMYTQTCNAVIDKMARWQKFYMQYIFPVNLLLLVALLAYIWTNPGPVIQCPQPLEPSDGLDYAVVQLSKPSVRNYMNIIMFSPYLFYKSYERGSWIGPVNKCKAL